MSLLQGNYLIGAAAAAGVLMLGLEPAEASPPGKQKQPEDYPAVQKAARNSVKKDGLSLLINLGGEPCARVLSKKHLGGDRFEIVCQENRQGPGTVRFLFDAAKGSASAVRQR